MVARGDLGVESSLTYAGIFIVQTAPGIFGCGAKAARIICRAAIDFHQADVAS